MKKSKLSITLVTSFIAAMALTACNEVTSNKQAIVSFKPYGSDESIALITDDVYNQYKNTSAGVSKFYDKILEVLIRYEFKEKGFKGELDYQEIENWAKNQVQEQKDKAKANAKSNGTKYDDEWDSILESNGVESSEELKQKFIYEKEKDVITKWYAEDVDETLSKEFIGLDADGNVKAESADGIKAAMPYHIRHILVKVDEASDAQEKFYKGTISEAQAQLLYDTVTTLASSKYTFSQVASMYSEDGSASSGGDVGIMTNAATSGSLGMVSEFQLGLYAYDVKYSGRAQNAEIEKGLGFNSNVRAKNDVGDLVDKTAFEALPDEAVVVPYEAFLNLGKYAKVTADKYGNKLANGSATVYPRNILWNKYLNMHNVFVIKNLESGATAFNTATANNEFKNLAGTDPVPGTVEASGNKTGFNADGYLTDGNNHIIIGVRSEYGIHFMTIEESMYDDNLVQYYSTKLPGEEDYSPKSYVGYIESQSKDDYKKRADDIKSKITSFDSTYDYRLYQWFSSADAGEYQVTINFADTALGAKIESYISLQKESNATKQEEGLEKVWKNYIRLLDVQKDNREAEPWKTPNPIGDGTDSPYLTRLVSEQIAQDFFKLYDDPENNKALYKEFAEG